MRKSTVAVLAGTALVTVAAPVSAQDAAETAVILSGTSAPQARAAQGLGNAVRGSINSATATIRTIPRAQPRGAPRSGNASPVAVGALPADSDPLENTDASAYRLGNGATIRVSGRLNPAAGTACTRNCGGPVAEDEQDKAQAAARVKDPDQAD